MARRSTRQTGTGTQAKAFAAPTSLREVDELVARFWGGLVTLGESYESRDKARSECLGRKAKASLDVIAKGYGYDLGEVVPGDVTLLMARLLSYGKQRGSDVRGWKALGVSGFRRWLRDEHLPRLLAEGKAKRIEALPARKPKASGQHRAKAPAPKGPSEGDRLLQLLAQLPEGELNTVQAMFERAAKAAGQRLSVVA